MYKLRSWIDETKLTEELSSNPNAVEYLEQHPEKIDYSEITTNINAIHIIENNIDLCDISEFNCNSNMENLLIRMGLFYTHAFSESKRVEIAEKLIRNNKINKINWKDVSRNSKAIHILEQYPEKISWRWIMHNKNAEHLIRNNLEKVERYWDIICAKPYLIGLIESYPEKIDWENLSSNHNAEHLLKNNLEKINIGRLCHNKNGFELLLQLGHMFDDDLYYDKNIVYAYWNHCKTHNIEFTLTERLCICGYTDEHFEFIKRHVRDIDYDYLSMNSNIFIYDYARMRTIRQQQPWYLNIISLNS